MIIQNIKVISLLSLFSKAPLPRNKHCYQLSYNSHISFWRYMCTHTHPWAPFNWNGNILYTIQCFALWRTFPLRYVTTFCVLFKTPQSGMMYHHSFDSLCWGAVKFPHFFALRILLQWGLLCISDLLPSLPTCARVLDKPQAAEVLGLSICAFFNR